MRKKILPLLLLSAVFFAGCASSTVIDSNPSGANLYLNGENVGTTPYSYKDTKIVGSRTSVKLKKAGYKNLDTSFSRSEQIDVKAIIGGVFVGFPFLWTMKYKPTHTYELTADKNSDDMINENNTKPTQVESKGERIRELKQLLDEKTLTQDEFERAKKQILEEDEKK